MTNIQPRNSIPWFYLVLAYGLAWLFWIPVAMTGQDYKSSPFLLILVLIGVFGPGMSGIVLTYRGSDREKVRDFWRRALEMRRVRWIWCAIILLLWPAMHLLSLVFSKTLGDQMPNFEFIGALATQPLGIPAVIVLYFLQSGLEELGWRGYMLEQMLQSWGAPRGSLIIGAFHALWHLPLFWVVGTNQLRIGFGVGFLMFVAQAIAFSLYATWCYLGNGHSTLAVTLLHTTGNLCLEIFAIAPGSTRNAIYTLVMVLGAAAVSIIWLKGGQDRSPNPASGLRSGIGT